MTHATVRLADAIAAWVADPTFTVVVAPGADDALGGGLAGALMEAAVAGSREAHGAGPVWFATKAENLRAQAFYRRQASRPGGRAPTSWAGSRSRTW